MDTSSSPIHGQSRASDAIARAWSIDPAAVAQAASAEPLPAGAVAVLPPGAVEATLAARPVQYTLLFGSILVATAGVVVLQLNMTQSVGLLFALMLGAVALVQLHGRGQWQRFTGETVPGSALLAAGWTMLHGAAAVVALEGADGRRIGGTVIGCCGAFAIWRASSGREVLAPAPLRFRSASTVQAQGIGNLVVAAVLIASTVVRIPPISLAVPWLAFLLIVKRRRRRSGLAAGADVPQDPRLKAPGWYTAAVLASSVIFMLVAMATDQMR